MQNSTFIALQVFGTGFIISMLIAVLIKVILYLIRLLSKKTDKNA